MDFSLVIPTHNGLRLLADCLGSIDKIDYPRERFEVIIVDNGSTDDTVKEIKKRKEIRIVRLSRNQGFAAASNMGASLAKGEYVFFLNNDTTVDPQILNGFRKVLDPVSGIKVAAAKIINTKTGLLEYAGGILNINHIGKCRGSGRPPDDFTVSDRTIFFSGGAFAIRRELFLSVGAFDEDFFAYYEDIDLSLRLNILGHRIFFAPDAIVHHAGGGTSRQLGIERLRIFHIRNPLLSIIKNTEDRFLARFLLHGLLISFYRTSGYLFEGRGRDIVKTIAGQRPLNPLAISDLKAYREIGSTLYKTILKRKRIQTGRVVGDSEVLRLFGEPFWAVEKGEAFERYSRMVRRALGIERLVKGGEEGASD